MNSEYAFDGSNLKIYDVNLESFFKLYVKKVLIQLSLLIRD